MLLIAGFAEREFTGARFDGTTLHMEREKPNLMRVQVQHEDGTVEYKTVRADSVALTKVRRHESLPPELEEKAKELYPRIGKLIHPTVAKWIDTFLHDQNPGDELQIWEKIADLIDKLWVEEPPVLKSIDRMTLTRIVIAISVGAVDIPSQINGVTDTQVAAIREAYESL